MGALVGNSIVEGLPGLHAFADHRRDFVRGEQRTGIDRGRLGRVGGKNLRRTPNNRSAHCGQQNPAAHDSPRPVVRAMGAKATSAIIGIDHCENSGKPVLRGYPKSASTLQPAPSSARV